jgi:hypothetical protein
MDALHIKHLATGHRTSGSAGREGGHGFMNLITDENACRRGMLRLAFKASSTRERVHHGRNVSQATMPVCSGLSSNKKNVSEGLEQLLGETNK